MISKVGQCIYCQLFLLQVRSNLELSLAHKSVYCIIIISSFYMLFRSVEISRSSAENYSAMHASSSIPMDPAEASAVTGPPYSTQFLCATQSLTTGTKTEADNDNVSFTSLTGPENLRPPVRAAARTCHHADSNGPFPIQRAEGRVRKSTPGVCHHPQDSGIMRSAPASVLKTSSTKKSSVNFQPGSGPQLSPDTVLRNIPAWMKEEESLPVWMKAPQSKPPQVPSAKNNKIANMKPQTMNVSEHKASTAESPASESTSPRREHRLRFWAWVSISDQ